MSCWGGGIIRHRPESDIKGAKCYFRTFRNRSTDIHGFNLSFFPPKYFLGGYIEVSGKMNETSVNEKEKEGQKGGYIRSKRQKWKGKGENDKKSSKGYEQGKLSIFGVYGGFVCLYTMMHDKLVYRRIFSFDLFEHTPTLLSHISPTYTSHTKPTNVWLSAYAFGMFHLKRLNRARMKWQEGPFASEPLTLIDLCCLWSAVPYNISSVYSGWI